MNNNNLLRERDHRTLWHPCSQMKDYEIFPPLEVTKAKGAYLYLKDGKKVLDAISSWWCKQLGHGHPRLVDALVQQAQAFEHVILANTTNDVIVNLSEKLTGLTQNLKKVFYASEGSSAVEIALKMAVHARKIRGQNNKTHILSLANSYHGETLFALAASDLGLYRDPYEIYFPKIKFLQNIPYVSSRYDALWHDCESQWNAIRVELEAIKETLSVVIVEPLLQASAGMLLYSQDFLYRVRRWCADNDIYFIADEIMTGFGRTGKMFATEHAHIEPDFMCIGKGMTAGFLPMSAVLLTDEIYTLFYDDYASGKSFLHSHTYSGNALAAAVAGACIETIQEEKILEKATALETLLYQGMLHVAEKTKKLTNVRAIGGMVAADLIDKTPRLGYEVYREAVDLGILLRPLGNTFYWVPPLNIDLLDIERLQDVTLQAILNTFKNRSNTGFHDKPFMEQCEAL